MLTTPREPAKHSFLSSWTSSFETPEDLKAATSQLSDAEVVELLYDWRRWARPEQILPGSPGAAIQTTEWSNWLLLAGRGFGKTRTGAETVREWKDNFPRIALIAPTAADAREVMVEGESGILAISPPGDRPEYEPSKRRLTWANGSRATLFSAEEPDRLRGPQHFKAWGDEIAAWAHLEETWDNLMFGLRKGSNPQAVFTTTPRPIAKLRELLKDPDTVVTRGSTYDNAANVSAKWLNKLLRKYEGTRLGRQELEAELLDDVVGALWTRKMIEDSRIDPRNVPQMIRVVVGVDPSVTNTKDSAQTGIIVAGLCVMNGNLHAVVFDDLSLRASAAEWAQQVWNAYRNYRADRVIGEVNNGGDLVERNIAAVNPNLALSYRSVRASRGKMKRAEPVSALYEQGRVHHVRGKDFAVLEDQMVTYVPGAENDESPDHMDALVWAITELMISPSDGDDVIVYDNSGGVQISPI